MSTSAIGTVLDAIRAALVLRAGLSGVAVYSGAIPVEEAGEECIAFGDGRLTEVELSMGGNRLETWVVGGETRVVKPWEGTTETTIAAARTRALAIFAELETHLNDTYTSTLPDVTLTSAEMSSGFVAEGRECRIGFEMTIQAAKNP
jgi:hypothetical protein